MAHPRLTFHGAARTVTGSCFRLETDHGQILIDCGLFQGSKTEKELNYRQFPFAAKSIDAVILTHAHIDHSGLLPKLTRDGFGGPIHASSATADLAGVMLPDSAHIQEFEVEQLNRRSAHRHRHMVDPIYNMADAMSCLEQFRPKPYDAWFDVLPRVWARIRSLDMYSGHADATEPVDWIRARLPLRHDLFLVHGEPTAIDALAARLDGVVAAGHILRPVLDETFELTPKGVQRRSITIGPRLPPEKLARLDWYNDVSRLILDINAALAATADDPRARRTDPAVATRAGG